MSNRSDAIASFTASAQLVAQRRRLGAVALASAAAIGVAVTVNQCRGKPVLFLRWSFLRAIFGMRHMGATWQVGDGREQALADYVCMNARRDDVADVIRAIDEFCYRKSFLINIGDEKGQILDRAVEAARPHRLLELGTYCGYSALRIARTMPADATLYSIEFSAANAVVARRIWDHAGIGDRIVAIVGTLGDHGATLGTLRDKHGFAPGTLDFVFLDHDKAEYLPDLKRIVDQGWLHAGSIVVADNVKRPGAPEYRAYMRSHEGLTWHSHEHQTHLEYQKIVKDLVLESTYIDRDE